MLRALSGLPRRPLTALAVLALLAARSPTADALDVDRAELEKAGTQKIVFINYEGPYARIDSSEDILGIGLALGRAIRAGATRAGTENRYYAVHAAAKGASDAKFDADVIGLGVDAGVDHIRNLRLILRGYLQAAYDYSPKDAALLAEFATVYNAVYRGDWKYFTDRYRDGALAALSPDKAGLSVRFDEWPGRAQIVIPLSEKAAPGSLSAVDTTSLTDKKVVEQLRKDEDKGIDSRKEMVDLKEREASEAKQTATLEREAIVDEEKKIADEKAAVAAEKERIAAEEKRLAESKRAAERAAAEKAAATGEPPAKSAPSAEEKKAEEQLAQDKAAVAAKEEEIAKKEEQLEERKEEAAAAESFAEKKDAEASADRTEIAKDQQQIIKEESAAPKAPPTGDLALRLTSSASPYARFVMIDKMTGTELKASPLDTVHARSTAEVGGKLVAVAGREGGNGAVRLVVVDKASLEMLKQGDVDIQRESPVWVRGDQLYALVAEAGGPRLARFDANLALLAKSSVPVHPYAVPSFAQGVVLVQGADGAVVVLKEADLSK